MLQTFLHSIQVQKLLFCEDILYFTQITAADIADNALTIPAYEAGMQIKLSGNINGVHTVVKTVAE